MTRTLDAEVEDNKIEDNKVERRFALWLCPLVLVVSVLKGMDGLNTAVATQALIDYRFGLVKRGLLGALLSRPLHFEKLSHFYVFSLIVFCILMVFLLASTLFGGLRERIATHTLLPLYFSSYALTFFAYCLGYSDLLLLCLTIPVLFIRSSTTRFIAAIPVAVTCILLHEMFLFLLLPLLLLSFLLETTLREERSTHRALFIKAILLLIVSLGVTFRVALLTPLTAPQIAQLQADATRRADFPLNLRGFNILRLSAADNSRLLWHVAHGASYWKRQGSTLITMFPNTLVLCLCIALVLRSVDRPVPRWLRLCCFAAALSPLALHLMAWDADRWNAETITTSLLVLILICRYTRGAVVTLSAPMRYAILFLIVFNVSIRAVVMEAHQIRHARPWLLLRIHT